MGAPLARFFLYAPYGRECRWQGYFEKEESLDM